MFAAFWRGRPPHLSSRAGLFGTEHGLDEGQAIPKFFAGTSISPGGVAMDLNSAFERTHILITATHAQMGFMLHLLFDSLDRTRASRQMIEESRALLILVDDRLRNR